MLRSEVQRFLFIACGCALVAAGGCRSSETMADTSDAPLPETTVAATDDFPVTGAGSAPAWEAAAWIPLQRRADGDVAYETRIKLLYSATGFYVLMDAEDAVLTSTMTDDFSDLWTEDVFEVFLWTDETYPIYFEYEISPLGYELPIIVPNFDGEFLGWRPWHYENERVTRRATAAIGGPKEPGAAVDGWRAEVFIPWALLAPLNNVPPEPGSVWRANFYRLDYDGDQPTAWFWAPVEGTFHQYRRFGRLRFGE